MKHAFVIIALCVACKPGNTREDNAKADSVSALAQEQVEQNVDSSNVEVPNLIRLESRDTAFMEMVDNEIATDPFEDEFETMLADIGQFEAKKNYFKNLHDSTQTDTIVTVSFDNSRIEYFKGRVNQFIISAHIESEAIKFKRGITVGMEKQLFISMFDDFQQADSINQFVLTDLEGLHLVKFVFRADKLFEATFQGYYD